MDGISGVELPVMALMNNSDGTNWQTRELFAMMTSPTARHRLIQTTVQYILAQKQTGLVIDFECLPEADQPDFHAFCGGIGQGDSRRGTLEIHGRATRRGLELRLQVIRRAIGRDHPDEL